MSPYPLFDFARNSDPHPSHVAAKQIAGQLVGLRAEFVERLGTQRMTANEIAVGRESIRKRANELVRMGVIRIVGERTCGVTGRLATVYEVTK